MPPSSKRLGLALNPSAVGASGSGFPLVALRRAQGNQRERGAFTLVELLLAIAIIGILAAITIGYINPKKQLAGARNAQRWSDTGNILESFSQFAVDNDGFYQPASVGGLPLDPGCKIPVEPAAAKKVCKGDTPHGNTAGTCGDPAGGGANQCIYASHLLTKYLVELAPDPQDTELGVEALRIDYTIRETTGGRLEVTAVNAEQDTTIRKSR